MFEKLRRLLAGRCLTNVFAVGSVDMDEDPVVFEAHLRFLYLEVGDHILEPEAVLQEGTLRISNVKHVRFSFTIEEGEIATISSVREFLLRPTAEYHLTSLTLFGTTDLGDHVLCDGARLTLENGQVLFFDPTYIYGIQVGGSSQEDCWRDNWNRGPIPRPLTMDLLDPA